MSEKELAVLSTRKCGTQKRVFMSALVFAMEEFISWYYVKRDFVVRFVFPSSSSSNNYTKKRIKTPEDLRHIQTVVAHAACIECRWTMNTMDKCSHIHTHSINTYLNSFCMFDSERKKEGELFSFQFAYIHFWPGFWFNFAFVIPERRAHLNFISDKMLWKRVVVNTSDI